MRKQTLLLALALSLAASAANATAAFFAPWGNNANAGTRTAPWAHLANDTDWRVRTNNYDTLYFLGGTYSRRFSGNVTRMDGGRIVFCPWRQETVVLDGTGLGLTATNSLLDLVNPSNVQVERLTVQNSSGRGISVFDGRNVTISRCTVQEVRERGIGGSGDDITIEDCTVRRACLMNENQLDASGSTRTGGWPIGIASWRWASGRGGLRWTLRRNTVTDTWGEGMSVQDTNGSVVEGNTIRNVFSVGLYANNCQNARFIGNQIVQLDTRFRRRDTGRMPNAIAVSVEGTLTNQPAAGLLFANNLVLGGSSSFKYWHSLAPGQAHNNNLPSNTYQDLTLAYNVFQGAEDSPIVIDAVPGGFTAPGNARFHNNIVDGPAGKAALSVGNASAWVFSHNDWVDGIPAVGSHSSSLAVAAGFVNPTATDASGFQLSSSSPLRSAGTPIAAVAVDFWNTARSATAPSIGLHEAPAVMTPPPAPAFMLASYSATATSKRSVTLSWSTSAEDGSGHFVVQRSLDAGQTYASLGMVAAAGGSANPRSYYFVDNTRNTKGWYRLQMVAANGSSSTSPVWDVNGPIGVVVAPGPGLVPPALEVYPVPANQASLLQLSLEATSAELVDAYGQRYVLHSGASGWRLPANARAGSYALIVRTPAGLRTTRMVVAP